MKNKYSKEIKWPKHSITTLLNIYKHDMHSLYKTVNSLMIPKKESKQLIEPHTFASFFHK